MTERRALVTGAAMGIGLGISARLIEQGYPIAMLDFDAAALEVAADGLREVGGRIMTIVADVSDANAVAQAIARIEREAGGLDILINNAGISPAHAGRSLPLEEMELAEWDHVIGVNLTGTFLTCRAAIPMMKRGGWGRIINFSSMGGRMRSLLSGAHYAATKAGVIGFTRVLAGQLGRHGITANCIAPGRIDTPQSRGFGDIDAFLAQLPVGRTGNVADIAAAVDYLISDAAGYVTGTVLDVNGGHYMP